MLQALPQLSGMDRWTIAGQPRGQSRVAACAVLVAGLHAALLAGLIRFGVPPAPVAAEMAGIPLVIEQVDPLASAALNPPSAAPPRLSVPRPVSVVTAPEPARDAPPAPPRHTDRAAPPDIVRQAASRAAPRSASQAAAAGPAAPGAGRQPQQSIIRQPVAATSPAPQANNPAPQANISAPQANNPAALAGLEARIDSAVQAASSMPEAAKRQHRQGRARLRFTYLDGTVDDIALVVSSDSRILDDAALTAVRRAHYPAAPAIARGRRLNLLVWIDFRLSPQAS